LFRGPYRGGLSHDWYIHRNEDAHAAHWYNHKHEDADFANWHIYGDEDAHTAHVYPVCSLPVQPAYR